MAAKVRPTSVPADPEQWSAQSKQSYVYFYRRTYEDIPYYCWHCQEASIFTAQDQKYTFEVKKASIDQRRRLCQACWLASHHVRKSLIECEQQWNTSKVTLRRDMHFLAGWLDLLIKLEKYARSKRDVARKNMLSKLIAHCHDSASPSEPAMSIELRESNAHRWPARKSEA